MLKPPMRVHALIVLFVTSVMPAFGGPNPTPIATINLDSIDRGADRCDGKWELVSTYVIWIDETHMALRLFDYCDSHDRNDRRNKERLVTVNSDGHIVGTWSDEWFAMIKGPEGTLLVNHAHSVDLMDRTLRTEQTIKCPEEKAVCWVFAPPVRTDSDFAVCYKAERAQNCIFYRGRLGAEIKEASFPLSNESSVESPYKVIPLPSLVGFSPNAVWKVSESEFWYFNKDQVLTSTTSNAGTGTSTIADWKPPRDTACGGDLSASAPHRFLAVCTGSYFYTDGLLDSIFGYSRIELFDVNSHRSLTRIDGPADTSASLSPSGKIIAVVTHDGKLRLYRVD
jgi:hypothetical protein